MATRPISFAPSKYEASLPATTTSAPNHTVGPFSAPDILPQYSPPIRQLSFGSPTNSTGHLVSNLLLSFSSFDFVIDPANTIILWTRQLNRCFQCMHLLVQEQMRAQKNIPKFSILFGSPKFLPFFFAGITFSLQLSHTHVGWQLFRIFHFCNRKLKPICLFNFPVVLACHLHLRSPFFLNI
jgi:hypothetical protein